MLYGKYQFICRFEKETILPEYKGSTLRGVFGHALKKVICALKRQTCDTCLLKQKCLYCVIFETNQAIESKDSRIAAPPHPFVIEPPLTTQTHFSKNDTLEFQLILFGNINHQLPYFIYAFDQIGKIGIGKHIHGQQGQFVLESVSRDQLMIYSNSDQNIQIPNAFQPLVLSDVTEYPDTELNLNVIFETPLRLKFENKLNADIPFHVFVRSLLRRVSSLLNVYGQGEPDIDYRGIIKRAEQINIIHNNLKWVDWRRYSNRQDKEMLMGGIIGEITYKGHIGEYMPLIEFCSTVHIGKQTTFGLGKFKAEIHNSIVT
ncbi:MAG: CRISPR system precrRNA processing endoribonuclease RAMP protein Cas6 [Desulfobacterales bacterium]|nr:CRISPR system precrRNA processing endoribonuclease RAMP protein Cas6 [Desulfobacterales bacterium]